VTAAVYGSFSTPTERPQTVTSFFILLEESKGGHLLIVNRGLGAPSMRAWLRAKGSMPCDSAPVVLLPAVLGSGDRAGAGGLVVRADPWSGGTGPHYLNSIRSGRCAVIRPRRIVRHDSSNLIWSLAAIVVPLPAGTTRPPCGAGPRMTASISARKCSGRTISPFGLQRQRCKTVLLE
jgi:hypothetical protein